MSKISGVVWVDREDFEVARLHFWLTEKVNIGWGIFGAVQALTFVMERVRMEDGVWLQEMSRGGIRYRQVVQSKHVIWRETSTGFARAGGR